MFKFIPSEQIEIPHPGDPELVVTVRVLDPLEGVKLSEATENVTRVERAQKNVEALIAGWRGVVGPDEQPLPFTPVNGVNVLLNPRLSIPDGEAKKSFLDYLVETANREATERGKGFGSSRNA